MNDEQEHPPPVALAWILTAVVVLSVMLFAVMRANSSTADGDPFDSSMYLWGWLLLPALAGAASWMGASPIASTLAAMAPLALGVALQGTVWHDPDDGASLWLAGEVFVIVQSTVCFAAARAGRWAAAVTRSGAG